MNIHEDQQEDEEKPLTGVCLIQQELDYLHKSNYSRVLSKAQQEIDDDPKAYKMKASEISQMQNLFQSALGAKLPFDDMQELFKADLGTFFEKLNEQIVKVHNFEKIHKFIQNRGRDPGEEEMQK